MAVIVAAATIAETNDSGNVTTYASGSFTPVANRLYLLAVAHSDAAPEATVPTVATTTGLAFVQVGSSLPYDTIASNLHRLTLFRAMKPSGLSTGTYTVTLADAGTGAASVLIEVRQVLTTGSDGADAVRNISTNSADAGTNPSITMGAFASGNNGVASFFGFDSQTAATASNAAWTVIGDAAYNTPATGVTALWTGVNSATAPCTHASADWAGIAVELVSEAVPTLIVPQPPPPPKRKAGLRAAILAGACFFNPLPIPPALPDPAQLGSGPLSGGPLSAEPLSGGVLDAVADVVPDQWEPVYPDRIVLRPARLLTASQQALAWNTETPAAAPVPDQWEPSYPDRIVLRPAQLRTAQQQALTWNTETPAAAVAPDYWTPRYPDQLRRVARPVAHPAIVGPVEAPAAGNTIRLEDDVYYFRNTDVPARTAYTVCGWVKVESTEGAFLPFMDLQPTGAVGADRSQVGMYIGLEMAVVGDTDVTVRIVELNRWFFFAMTGSGTTLTGFTRYEGESSLTTGAATQATFTAGELRVNRNSSAQSGTARYRHIRVWDAVLSSADLLAESASYTVVRTSNLNGDYPFTSFATDDEDQSGLDNDWTILLGDPLLVDDVPDVELDAVTIPWLPVYPSRLDPKPRLRTAQQRAFGAPIHVPDVTTPAPPLSWEPNYPDRNAAKSGLRTAQQGVLSWSTHTPAAAPGVVPPVYPSRHQRTPRRATAGIVEPLYGFGVDVSIRMWAGRYPDAIARRKAIARGETVAPLFVARHLTLTADPGSVTITGTAATLEAHRRLVADPGSVSITGTAATLEAHRRLVADPGSVTITGTAAALRREYTLSAQSGSITITGTAATFDVSRELAANSGSVSITGTVATLEAHRRLVADPGSVAITGTNATLRREYTLSAQSGSITITGTAATLRREYILSAQSGSVVITGTAATLAREGATLAADAGAVTLTGTAATLEAHRRLAAGSGSVAITGTAATFRLGYALSAQSGSIVITGTDASLSTSPTLAAEPGIVTITGTAATLEAHRRLAANAFDPLLLGSGPLSGGPLSAGPLSGAPLYVVPVVIIAGTPATLRREFTLSAQSGSYVITGTAATLEARRRLAADPGSVTITGTAATLTRESGALGADVGTVTITGTAASLLAGRTLAATSGTFTITGTAATFRYGYALAANAGSVVITGTAATLATSPMLSAESGSVAITGTSASLLAGRYLEAEGVAAFPTVVGTAMNREINVTFTSVITLPTHQSGDLLVVCYSCDQTSTLTESGGPTWTKIGQTSYLTNITGAVFYKVAASSSEALTLTLSAAMRSSHISYAIRGSTGVVYSSSNANNTNNSNPPTLNPAPGVGNYLCIAARMGDANVVATAPPSGFTNWQSQVGGGSGGGASTDTAEAEFASVSSIDPGVFTSASEQWVCWTLAMQGLGTGVTTAITGTDVALVYTRAILANSGSYTITGTDATLEVHRELTADPGSVVITGIDAGLSTSPTITAESGTVIITGIDAGLTRPLELTADPGSVIITGTDAGLNFFSNKTLAASSGSYLITGTPANFLLGYRVDAQPGSVSLTGTSASLRLGRFLTAQGGAYAISGTAATFALTKRIDALAGSVALSGTAAALRANRLLTAASGSSVITGTAMTLRVTTGLAAGAGSITITGTDADFDYQRRLVVLSGSVIISGTAATLVYNSLDSVGTLDFINVAMRPAVSFLAINIRPVSTFSGTGMRPATTFLGLNIRVQEHY